MQRDSRDSLLNNLASYVETNISNEGLLSLAFSDQLTSSKCSSQCTTCAIQTLGMQSQTSPDELSKTTSRHQYEQRRVNIADSYRGNKPNQDSCKMCKSSEKVHGSTSTARKHGIKPLHWSLARSTRDFLRMKKEVAHPGEGCFPSTVLSKKIKNANYCHCQRASPSTKWEQKYLFYNQKAHRMLAYKRRVFSPGNIYAPVLGCILKKYDRIVRRLRVPICFRRHHLGKQKL